MRFLHPADAAFETNLPVLFFTIWLFVRPPLVFSLLPRNTTSFLSLPLATLLTFMAFFFIAVFITTFQQHCGLGMKFNSVTFCRTLYTFALIYGTYCCERCNIISTQTWWN